MAISKTKKPLAKKTSSAIQAKTVAKAQLRTAKVSPRNKPSSAQAKSAPVSSKLSSELDVPVFGAAANKSAKNSQTAFSSNALASARAIDDVAGRAIANQAPRAEPGLQENLAKTQAGSLKSSLRIFQIYYESWQRELLDPNFAALDNSKGRSELLEFAVFDQLATSDYVKGAQLWGALSWRFGEKTGMSGSDWIKNITSNPGADVYFCDPFVYNEALYHNLWLQGETTHPQFLALCQAVFQAAGLPVEDLVSMYPSEQYSAANFFVGNAKFWSAYIPWVKEVLSAANKKLPPKVRDLMHSPQADERDLHKGASYVPFIVERLFPVFMKTAGKHLKGHKIALPERERELNVHLKLLREMKDVAHRTKSAWLAACWVNYRNLYLTQVNDKAWCNKHLRTITPTNITFF